MLPELRGYQVDDLGAVRCELRQHRAVVLVEPTGAGKGTLAAYIVNSATEQGYSVTFLVNRRDLVDNMSERVGKLDIPHSVLMGDDRRYRSDSLVQVASIDTIYRREQRPRADLLIADEAHFAVTPTWRGVLDSYPQAKILGLTATPIRTDGRGLGEVFQSMVVGPSTAELIRQKYLVPSVVFRPPMSGSLEGVRKGASGEYNMRQLAEVTNKPKLVGDLVAQWQKRASHRKTVAFCVDKDHAWKTAESFRCAGFDWAYVDDETPRAERLKIWADYDHGRLNGVSSIGVISYGWDHGICSCLILARATASEQLLRQMLGRGGRPYPDKTNFYVMDHWDNMRRLDVMFEDEVQWTLDGIAKRGKGEDKPPSITTCKACYATFRSGPTSCPFCLAPLPVKKRKFQTVNGELVEVTDREPRSAKDWAQSITTEQRKWQFREFQRTAIARRYKPTWALVKYKALFGYWPPREWTR